MPGTGHRVRRVDPNPNPLFKKWIEEFLEEAISKNMKSLTKIYSVCLDSLKRYPLPLPSGQHCRVLAGFGKTICNRLDEKLESHRKLTKSNDVDGCMATNTWQHKESWPKENTSQSPKASSSSSGSLKDSDSFTSKAKGSDNEEDDPDLLLAMELSRQEYEFSQSSNSGSVKRSSPLSSTYDHGQVTKKAKTYSKPAAKKPLSTVFDDSVDLASMDVVPPQSQEDMDLALAMKLSQEEYENQNSSQKDSFEEVEGDRKEEQDTKSFSSSFEDHPSERDDDGQRRPNSDRSASREMSSNSQQTASSNGERSAEYSAAIKRLFANDPVFNRHLGKVDKKEKRSKSTSVTSQNQSNNVRKGKEYVPKERSGGYAVLIALYTAAQNSDYKGYMSKTELQTSAQPLCDQSLTRATGRAEFHTAWSAVSTLVKHELVTRYSNPAKYAITDKGAHLAARILRAEGGGPVFEELENVHPATTTQFAHRDSEANSSHKRTSNKSKRDWSTATAAQKKAATVAAVASKPSEDEDRPHTSGGDRPLSLAGQAALRRLEQNRQHHFQDDRPKPNDQHLRNNEVKEPDHSDQPPDNNGSQQLSESFLEAAFSSPMLVTASDSLQDGHRSRSSRDWQVPTDSGNNHIEEHEDFRPASVNASQISKINEDQLPMGLRLQNTIECGLLQSEAPKRNTHRPEFRLAGGSYDVILCVDNTETAGGGSGGKASLKKETVRHLEQCKVSYERRNLNIGDFLWVARERRPTTSQPKELVLPYIVERKRLDDLWASVKDGRYEEQKFRMKASGLTHLYYLIEHFNMERQSWGAGVGNADAIQQAIANTAVQEGFSIIKTQDQRETVHYLTMFTRVLEKKYNSLTLESCTQDDLSAGLVALRDTTLLTFNELNSTARKNKKMSLNEIFAKMLLRLKGLSVEMANSIVQAYPTPRCFLDALENCSSLSEQIQIIQDVGCGTQSRKIPKTIAEALVKFWTSHDINS